MDVQEGRRDLLDMPVSGGQGEQKVALGRRVSEPRVGRDHDSEVSQTQVRDLWQARKPAGQLEGLDCAIGAHAACPPWAGAPSPTMRAMKLSSTVGAIGATDASAISCPRMNDSTSEATRSAGRPVRVSV